MNIDSDNSGRISKADKSRIKRNLLANYAGTVISTALPLLTLPIFLYLLGEETWGLIAFFWLMIGLVSIIEAGIGHALIREFGIRLNDRNDLTQNINNLIHTYERLYWAGSGLCAALLFLSSDLIVGRWLNLNNIPKETGELAVYAAASMIVITISVSIYRSILIAAKAQVQLNILTSIISILRYGGGVIVVYVESNITVYLSWQLLISLIEFCWYKQSSKQFLPRSTLQSKFEYSELRSTIPQASKLIGSTLLWAFTLQTDKLIVSALLPISQFGFYSIASSLALGILRLTYPIQNTLLPHLIESRKNHELVRNYNIHAYRLIIGLWLCIGICYGLIGEPVLAYWLRNSMAFSEIERLMPLLLFGSALNSLYGITYINWLAHGDLTKLLKLNILFFIICLIVAPIAISRFGLYGATFSWLSINLISLLFSYRLFFYTLFKH